MYDKEDLVMMINEGRNRGHIAEHYGVSIPTVSAWAKKAGASFPLGSGSRRYRLQEDAFSCVDTEQKAYLLGFLAADGYIDKHEKVLSLAVQNRDVEVLNWLRECLASEHPVRQMRDNLMVVEIGSKRLVADLKRLGIVRHKSRNLFVPSLDATMMRHYLRGLFDGDGFVKQQVILATCAPQVIEYIIDLCEAQFGSSPKPIHRKGGTVGLRFNRDLQPFVSWMYSECGYVLSRKAKTAQEHKWTCRNQEAEAPDKKPAR